ncbi:MAG: tetratricopeptide repeat protein, partial [Methylococcales bacterium]
MNTKSYQKMIAIFCLLVMSGCVDSVRKTQQYLESAERYYDQENYAKARLEYRNALQIDNQQVDAYYYLALMDEKDKSWKSMYANLLQVIKLDSRHVDARLRLGNLHLLSGQLEQADQLIDEIFTLVTDNPKAFVLKAALLLRQKDTMAAMDMVDKALAIDPGQIAAISLKVVIYQAQNDFNAAMSSIDQALQLNPDDLSLNFLKLQLHIKQGDNAAIEKDYLALI